MYLQRRSNSNDNISRVGKRFNGEDFASLSLKDEDDNTTEIKLGEGPVYPYVFDEDYKLKHTPPDGRPDRLFRINWLSHITFYPNTGPQLPVEFVAAQGRVVYLIDVRESEEDLIGPTGYITGVDWIPYRLARELIVQKLDKDDPIVLVSTLGETSGQLALELHKLGFTFVAAMTGGLLAWKNAGYLTSRNPRILKRKGQFSKHPPLYVKHKPVTTINVDAILNSTAGAPAPSAPVPDSPAYIKRENFTLDDARKVMAEQPVYVRWMKMAALLLHGKIACVDGRDDTGVIGTPGGDTGEFVVLLSAAENLAGKTFTRQEVRELLMKKIDSFGHFYMHSDLKSVTHLIDQMRENPKLAPYAVNITNTYRAKDFFTSPPMEIQDDLLDLVVDSTNIGCGHIRLCINHSNQYHVRDELVKDIIRAAYSLFWDGHNEIELVILEGERNESGVINVTLDKVASFSNVPLVSPSFGNTRHFVNHPQVSAYLRNESAKWMVDQTDIIKLPPGCEKALHDEMERIANLQITETLSYLAKGLPIIDLHFSGTGHDNSKIVVGGKEAKLSSS